MIPEQVAGINMKKLIAISFWLMATMHAWSQTAQLNFVFKNGSTVGRSSVMDLPISLFQPWVPQGQLLVFYPPAYKAGKTCGLICFLPGDGENRDLDISKCNVNSLPRMIAAGMTPYSLLANKDTLWWVVVSIHNNSGSAYRTQLTQILPWIFDKSGIKIDPKHVWISGLSGGGSATWASIMIDTSLAKRITGIFPLANGGYDDNLPKLQGNLIAAAQHGIYFFPYIGTQDPGYNATGFFAYDALLRTYALKDHYHPHVIINGTHSANVWDVPWNDRKIWDSIGIIGYTPNPPPIPKVKAILKIDSQTIHYPTTVVTIIDSSINSYGGSWDLIDGPNKPIINTVNVKKAIFSGLIPGIYRIGLHAYGEGNTINDFNNVDSTYVDVVVYGPPACPPPRTLSGIEITIVNGSLAWKLTYSDGTIEIKQP